MRSRGHGVQTLDAREAAAHSQSEALDAVKLLAAATPLTTPRSVTVGGRQVKPSVLLLLRHLA